MTILTYHFSSQSTLTQFKVSLKRVSTHTTVQLKSYRHLSPAEKCRYTVMFTSVQNGQTKCMCHGDVKQSMLAVYKKASNPLI